MSASQVSLPDRWRQARRLIDTEGVRGVTDRVRRRGANLLAPAPGTSLRVAREDFRGAADLIAAGGVHPAPLPWKDGEPLEIAWVDMPPSAGSGGQTTIFRMVQALEAAGHHCVLYVLDQHGWSMDQHRATIARWWPGVRAEIRDVRDGIADAHAVIATCWESVYPVVASPSRGTRFYFVQDFEPLFHPAGSEYLLAEATYRFGLHGITAGRWLAQKLARDYDMVTDSFDFGCDPETYPMDQTPEAARLRRGICYYGRPSTPRRAHALAVAALDLFAEQHPEVEIHLYGERLDALPFAATQHGLLSPTELGALYNRCVAGLTLSATNVSLVPLEMLSAGFLPVVNDADHNRIVLDNDHVQYARATPFDLAASLAALVERPPEQRAVAALAASRSVAGASWATAGQHVARVVRDAVRATQV